MKTIAVTAASGQLGAGVVRAAAELVGRQRVIGLARTSGKGRFLEVEIRPGDYADRPQLAESLQGIESLLLVSGMDAPEKRISQHRNVIAAAQQAGVRRIVYTSIQGAETGTAFSPIVQSNRQTEDDIRSSGLNWVIGRNGIYIEPDIEYVDTYRQRGEIANCAGTGRCGYATRSELAYAYARMLTQSAHEGHTYNLHGEPITQQELADYLNDTLGTKLRYRSMSVSDYREGRVAELGEFMGNVIAGIYEGIRQGAVNNESHYALAAGRAHQSWAAFFSRLTSSAIIPAQSPGYPTADFCSHR